MTPDRTISINHSQGSWNTGRWRWWMKTCLFSWSSWGMLSMRNAWMLFHRYSKQKWCCFPRCSMGKKREEKWRKRRRRRRNRSFRLLSFLSLDKYLNQQVKARHGQPILICERDDKETIAANKGCPVIQVWLVLSVNVLTRCPYICHSDSFLFSSQVPRTVDCLQGILNIVPLQLLSYHVAVKKGFNVDCPRNLAKSVTVQWLIDWSPIDVARYLRYLSFLLSSSSRA